MREMILLGAGASKEAGVPTAYNMTEVIIKKFYESPQYQEHAELANFIIGGLLFQEGMSGQNPLNSGVNVEDFFNAVLMLADRRKLEAAPFVGSWHSMVEKFDKAKPSTISLDHLIKKMVELARKEMLAAFSESPSSFEAAKIDDTLRKAIIKIIEAKLKADSKGLNVPISAHFSFSESIGRSIDTYMEQVVKNWTNRLKKDLLSAIIC